uniref:Radical SAM core domain-containing protein n=1 Tax=Chromera velia CCMP2878 TaxID=1169474 RepID=A0A0G4F9H8_9ALVE|eukprot:Cvel_15887.t1-p1 / transcript=Cvel_15887.t1 / gene=Cvel_15887 / organism=Chromera_velia_CCMP2878 / gene_product=tRNA wybutosine-synthesizing protein 1 homolog, putative / transcript_product=tRNA wybutosine-synthesizing protein 1 homolog, putative / location=Cvel_scaffold1199:40482-45692(-) / protein_length=592 / sequence_SO=supercontig / SO=protein_coding / is_pseudo=false
MACDSLAAKSAHWFMLRFPFAPMARTAVSFWRKRKRFFGSSSVRAASASITENFSPRPTALNGLSNPNTNPSAAPSKSCGSCSSPKPPAQTETETEMLSERMNESMGRFGFSTVGTHSAVKICRWTKQQLMGRAGCYKHTFYGIQSHRCMETTTSLACANRCVFCWRHHMHPVAKKFQWKVDDPRQLLEDALQTHLRLIKPLRGAKGVTPERFAEALAPRHCALSLVGEPIMYPRINEFVDLLHSKRLSTFLVTNGQHPAALAELSPITQLYVSVDAPNRDDLKKIDRPLFSDFWERLLVSCDVLKEKRQRTVLRLTLVKGWNDRDLEGYAKLVERSGADFVEVKGVMFCGGDERRQWGLGLQNTPQAWETRSFAEALCSALNLKGRSSAELSGRGAGGSQDAVLREDSGYGLACEHAHSNSCLIASNRFLVSATTQEEQGAAPDESIPKSTSQSFPSSPMQWHTWIDFDRFADVAGEGCEALQRLDAQAYAVQTPDWALLGSPLQGFDPSLDVERWKRLRDGRPARPPGSVESGSTAEIPKIMPALPNSKAAEDSEVTEGRKGGETLPHLSIHPVCFPLPVQGAHFQQHTP